MALERAKTSSSCMKECKELKDLIHLLSKKL